MNDKNKTAVQNASAIVTKACQLIDFIIAEKGEEIYSLKATYNAEKATCYFPAIVDAVKARIEGALTSEKIEFIGCTKVFKVSLVVMGLPVTLSFNKVCIKVGIDGLIVNQTIKNAKLSTSLSGQIELPAMPTKQQVAEEVTGEVINHVVEAVAQPVAHTEGDRVPEPAKIKNAFVALAEQRFKREITAILATPERRKSKLIIEKNRQESNGIKHPSKNTLCADIWALCDECRDNGEIPKPKRLKELTAMHGISPVTTTVQLYRWRKFNGISA